MDDQFPRESAGPKYALKGRECGNGVVVDHGQRWETQYCHMRQGSVRVSVGPTVERGTSLGDVGFSGLADTAHLHLTVRHLGRTVDRFTDRRPDGTCLRDGTAAVALFEDAATRAFPYHDGDFLQTGFAGRAVGWAELEHDHTTASRFRRRVTQLSFSRA
jgi:murein DD-endopeptidase MepM/ murein hydrolase activator NlpD